MMYLIAFGALIEPDETARLNPPGSKHAIYFWVSYIVTFSLLLTDLMFRLRSKDPEWVYELWWWFSTFFVAAIVAFLYITTPQDYLIPRLIADVISWYIDLSIKPGEEALFIIAVFCLVVVPQIFSYLVAGLVGCGSRPNKVKDMVQWSLFLALKTGVIYSGINAANALLDILGKPPGNVEFASKHFLQSTFAIYATFLLTLLWLGARGKPEFAAK